MIILYIYLGLVIKLNNMLFCLMAGAAKNSYQGANDLWQMQNQGHEDCRKNIWLIISIKLV
jgi:hypothetical protein